MIEGNVLITKLRGDSIKVVELEKRFDMNTFLLLLEKYKILVVPCEGKELEQKLISLLNESVKEEISSDYASDKCDFYQKTIDYIEPESINSSLKVRDYLVFYAMISKKYNATEFENQINDFSEFCEEDFWDKCMNDISRQEKIVVRCMISYISKVKILFGKDFFKGITKEEKENLTIFLKKYFTDNSSYCVLLEDSKNIIKNR